MAGFIYQVKTRSGPDGGEGEAAFSFAWAERVRRIAGRLQAENIQVPVASLQDGRLQLESRRLPERTFDGHAYPCRPPAWHVGDPPAPAPDSAAGRRAILEEKLRITPLGRMCLHPEVRLALAQDRLAATLEPLLRIPDLLAGEEELAAAWGLERPEAAAQAAASADLLASADDLSREEGRWRRRLRVAALRRLDAAAVGREIYLPCPAYFGEPYLAFALTPEFSLKAGPVRRMKTWPNPESEARSRVWRADRELVAAVENRLLPVLAPSAGDSTLALWLALAPVREFEARSRWPLFPQAAVSPDDPPPPGFTVRIRPETMRGLGGSYRTLATAGLSPYLAEPFGAYCRTRPDLLAAWSEDVAALAMAKWGAT